MLGGGLIELKIDFGPGYRVYAGLDGNSVILLWGGDKHSQDADIARARNVWREYNAEEDEQLSGTTAGRPPRPTRGS
jgi:putative component of toxin-antitoxin plasmid stabilization module